MVRVRMLGLGLSAVVSAVVRVKVRVVRHGSGCIYLLRYFASPSLLHSTIFNGCVMSIT